MPRIQNAFHITRRSLLHSSSILTAGVLMGFEARTACAALEQESNSMKAKTPGTDQIVYVGSRTTLERNARGAGITVYRYNATTGAMCLIQTVGDLVNPSFLCLDHSQSLLFCVHGDQSQASSFRIDPNDGTLTLISTASTEGRNPVHLSVDKSNSLLAVANYATGSIVVLPFDETGRLNPVASLTVLPGNPGPHKVEQTSSHPHMIPYDPSSRFLVVPDKGLDRIFVFDSLSLPTNATPRLVHEIKARAGSGPRHVVFAPSSPYAYVVNELDSTVTSYRFSAQNGELTPFQVESTLPNDFTSDSNAAALVMAPSGKLLFASNRGHDSVTAFKVDSLTGKITALGSYPTQGRKPRFMTVSPDGRFLFAANEESDTIKTFSVQESGELKMLEADLKTGSPVCMVFRPV